MIFKNKKTKKKRERERHKYTTEIQGRCPQDVEQPETKTVRSSETGRVLTVRTKKKKKTEAQHLLDFLSCA